MRGLESLIAGCKSRLKIGFPLENLIFYLVNHVHNYAG